MFDFESDDPHLLPFSRNEILTVVKMEESGWWAAMRPNGDRLGWIPSSFVERLTESPTEELDEEADDTRIYDHEGGNASISEGETDSDCIQVEEIFNPVSDAVKPSLLSNYQLARRGFQDSEGSNCLHDSFFSLSDDEPSPHDFARPSPSPLCNVSQPLITPSSPVSHIPTKSLDTLDLHSSGVPNLIIDPERSLPSSPYSRRPRRLAVLVNDSDSLSCLSAFIDQDHSSAFHALDSLRVNEMLDAFSRKSHAKEEPSFHSRCRC